MKPSEVAQHIRTIIAEVAHCRAVMDESELDGTTIEYMTWDQYHEINQRVSAFLIIAGSNLERQVMSV